MSRQCPVIIEEFGFVMPAALSIAAFPFVVFFKRNTGVATVFFDELQPHGLHVIIEEFGFVSPDGVAELYLRPFPFAVFFKRTPGPPPFSSMPPQGSTVWLTAPKQPL